MEDIGTYYELLGVSESASYEEIRDAYRRMSLQYHPDRLKKALENFESVRKDAEEKYKEINHAWSVLKDRSKRSAYDQLLSERRSQSQSDIPGYSGQSPDFWSPPPPEPPPPPIPTLNVSESEFHFTDLGLGEKAVGTFVISSSCGSNLQAKVVSSVRWLKVWPCLITSSQGRQEVEFSVDTSDMKVYEKYSGEITIESNVGNQEINIHVVMKIKEMDDIGRYFERVVSEGGRHLDRVVSDSLKDALHQAHSHSPWTMTLAALLFGDRNNSRVWKQVETACTRIGMLLGGLMVLYLLIIFGMFLARSR